MPAHRFESLAENFLAAREKHLGDQPDDLTKRQMLQQAANADIDGTSEMSKDELEENPAQEAES